MPEGGAPDSADDAVRPLIDGIADEVRTLADRPWQRARLVAKYTWSMSYDVDVAFELGDGAELRLRTSRLKVIDAVRRLQDHYRDHGSCVFVLRCTVTPEAVEHVDVDTTSDPWPDGWDDPACVAEIRLPPEARPDWLRRRLDALERKRPTRAALWTIEAQHLLAHLGPGWDTRGSGNKLALVRQRDPWLLDVIILDRTRSPQGGRPFTGWIDLLDGSGHLTLGHGTQADFVSLEAPDARRRLLLHVLGPGYFQLEHAHPIRVAIRLGRHPDVEAGPDLQTRRNRRDAKLAALGLDAAGHKTLRPMPPDEHVVYPPVSWEEVADGLTTELTRLPGDSVIILHEWRKGGAAIRFTRRRGDGRLEVELRPDHYLATPSRGGPDRDDRLRSLGWLEPDGQRHGLPSWRRLDDAAPATLAAVAVDVARTVYGIERPERLGFTATSGRDTALLMPALPLLSFEPTRYLTQSGTDADPETARNGAYALTSTGEHRLLDVDGTSYIVVDDVPTLTDKPVLAHKDLILVPTPDSTEIVRIRTIATPVGSTSAAGLVLRRQGTSLELLNTQTRERSWTHQDDVTVHEVRDTKAGGTRQS